MKMNNDVHLRYEMMIFKTVAITLQASARAAGPKHQCMFFIPLCSRFSSGQAIPT
jgi:hypothetical protein